VSYDSVHDPFVGQEVRGGRITLSVDFRLSEAPLRKESRDTFFVEEEKYWGESEIDSNVRGKFGDVRLVGRPVEVVPELLEITSRFTEREVLDHLRTIAEDEKGSFLPERVKKLGGKGALVRINGERFQLACVGRWTGSYNPRCAGTVQPFEGGSRIVARAGFSPVALVVRLGTLGLFSLAIPPAARWIFTVVLFVAGLVIVDAMRHTGPWRAAMFDIVRAAAENRLTRVGRDRSTISESVRRLPRFGGTQTP
jgi:hypothetical protein